MTAFPSFDIIFGMLIPHREKNEKTYFVECANWSSVVNAEDPEEGATQAFEEALGAYGKSTEVSPVFTVLDLDKSMKELEIADNIHFVYAPKVLANADMHKTSADLQFIIENLKKNSE